MFAELRELLRSGAIRRHQLRSKYLSTPTSYDMKKHKKEDFPVSQTFDQFQALYSRIRALQPCRNPDELGSVHCHPKKRISGHVRYPDLFFI